MNARSTSVVICAQNQASTIARLIAGLRKAADWHEIVVVDDGSRDGTGAAATAAGARVVRHAHARGLGAAIKAGARAACGTSLLVMPPDGAYEANDALRLIAHLDEYELAVAARSDALQQAESGIRLSRLLNRLATHLAEQPIVDLTSRFCAVNRACLLEFAHLLPNGSTAPAMMTLAFVRAGYSVRFEPVDRTPDAAAASGSAHNRASLLGILKTIAVYSPLRLFLPVSLLALTIGTAYALWTISTQAHVTNSSVVLILLSVVIFLVGLVSEQLASLYFEGRRE